MTREDIFQKWIDTGKAEYNGNLLSSTMHYCSGTLGTGEMHHDFFSEELDHGGHSMYLYCISTYDILFGPSNFFEVMFPGGVIDASEYCPRGARECCCGNGLTEAEYHKMQCVLTERKLQYLIDNLPK